MIRFVTGCAAVLLMSCSAAPPRPADAATDPTNPAAPEAKVTPPPDALALPSLPPAWLKATDAATEASKPHDMGSMPGMKGMEGMDGMQDGGQGSTQEKGKKASAPHGSHGDHSGHTAKDGGEE